MNGALTDVATWAAFAPLLALLGAVLNGLFGRKLKEPLPGILASLMVGAGFLLSLTAFIALLGRDDPRVTLTLWHFLQAGELRLELGFIIDSLSVLLMLIISGVGLLIHLYSIGYMHGDPGYSRYFSHLNLFVAAMMILVMADSFLLMFIGWEGVGVCSYLLIGFWYDKRENADASRKAFIVNRIGDVGFLLGMFLTFRVFGTLNIPEVKEMIGSGAVSMAAISVIALFFVVAALGKSAQIPLQVWLPDAMAGPTPVSALIHAATMVTAGVYLIARAAPLFGSSPFVSAVIAWIGVLTALIAAFAAFSQLDIKKILAYSTISQLGFMFAAAGTGAYWDSIFHLFTHAFFKALLFLCAGSVIHAMQGEQNIERMGGLGKHLPLTGFTALIGTLAISGVPLLSSFFSKDVIMADMLTSELIAGYGQPLLYVLLLLAEGMTAFYMLRWYYRVFAGQERFDREVRRQLHESPAVMTVPLLILAAFSVVSGYVGLPEVAFPNWIAPWIAHATLEPAGFRELTLGFELLLASLSIVAVIVGFGAVWFIYHKQAGAPVQHIRDRFWQTLNRLSQEGGGFDIVYRALFVKPSENAAASLAKSDRELIDKGVTSVFGSVGLLARAMSALQSGYVRAYALAMLLGVVLLSLLVALVGGAV